MSTDDFDAFVRARGDDLFRVAYLLTQSRHDAEDLVQTALTRSLPRWKSIAADDPYGYVRTVMVNTRRGWWRKDHGRTTTMAHLPDTPGRDELGDSDERDRLRRVLAALPEGQRKVIILRYFEDMTEAETAHSLGCSIGTVKSQASRAMARLRGVLALDATGGRGK